MPKNPYPWPSITNVAASVNQHVKDVISTLDQAADLIAIAWRHRRDRLHNPDHDPAAAWAEWRIPFGMFRSRRLKGRLVNSRDFHDFYLGLPCVASQKYDGTNVGVTEEGTMLGRRFVIDRDADRYQVCLLYTSDAADE